jgi:hypothetical protein
MVTGGISPLFVAMFNFVFVHRLSKPTTGGHIMPADYKPNKQVIPDSQ